MQTFILFCIKLVSCSCYVQVWFKMDYLFFSVLGPRPHISAIGPKILLLQFQGIGWYDRDEVLKLSPKL